ncbi:hypothetical protein HFN89_00250 [Rhizobium laguerreae]|nr:hypothetical protein [Rhizobium laguerreae]
MEPSEHERRYRKQLEKLAHDVHQRSGEHIGQLIVQCLLPAMMRDAAVYLGRGGVATHYISGELDHVADWLAAALAADLKWLRNVDANGVPRKFSKFATVEDVKAEANRATERLLRNTLSRPPAEGEEVTVAELADGYRVVSLISPGALDRESKEMQHCVGLGGYDEGVRSGQLAILSLRDRKGKAHATMELHVENGWIAQLKGKQNRFPVKRYFDILLPWIAGRGYEINSQELAGGYFKQRDGAVRHVAELTEGEEIEGDLTLRFDGDADVDLVLPNGLRVDGGIEIRAEYAPGKRVFFGADTVAGGQVQTFGAVVVGIEKVTSPGLKVIAGALSPVPDGSRISGDLYLSGVAIGDILEKAVIEGGVEIRDINRVTIPAGISVRGAVAVAGAELVSVQRGVSLTGGLGITGGVNDCVLTVGRDVSMCGSFSISNCSTYLSEGLRVGGDFTVAHGYLESLPSRLEVGGLTLNRVSGATSIPASVVINGDVVISGSEITSLGGRAVWPGSLRIPKMQIAHLPYGLTVGGSLEVSWVPLLEFPQAMRIGGGLTAVGCKAGRIPEDAVIGGAIDLSRNNDAALPDGTVVHGELKLNDAYFKVMPTGVKVDGMLSLGRFPVDRISRFFEAKSYVLSESFVIDISDLAEIEENIWVDAKDASKLPEGMHVRGKLIIDGNAEGARLPDGITVDDYVRVTGHSEVPPSLIPPTATVGGTRTNTLRL